MILYVKINPQTNDLIIHANNHETIIEKFNYISKLEEALSEYGYNKTNNTYKYQS